MGRNASRKRSIKVIVILNAQLACSFEVKQKKKSIVYIEILHLRKENVTESITNFAS